jgi:type VI secretion system secreted protein Hcp
MPNTYKMMAALPGALVLSLIFNLLLPAGTARAAASVKFDGVDGEAKDKDHRNWCDLSSFVQEALIPEKRGGATRRRGRAVMEPIVITKELDKASPKLAEALLKGRVFRSALIHVTASFGDAGRSTYYEYELKNVRVVRYKIHGSGGSGQAPVEEIALAFDEVKVTYTEYDNAGKIKGKVEYTWRAESGRR